MKQEIYQQACDLYQKPLFDLVFEAHKIHRNFYDPHDIQKCALLSIKTGGCPEDCAYCPQSAHYKTGLERQPLLSVDQVKNAAQQAKKRGAQRFCMGAAWRNIKNNNELNCVLEMVKIVKNEGLEVCVTLGMLNFHQAQQLKEAGVYAYNHNLDTSRNYYAKIITTRTYDDRLETLQHVRQAGMTICSGGIFGMGETAQDRCALIAELASINPQPESVPLNLLIPIKGTPLANSTPINSIDLIRLIAVTRILIPKARLRLSAGRTFLNREAHLLAFFAGANSIFIGDKLLTRTNNELSEDEALLESFFNRLN